MLNTQIKRQPHVVLYTPAHNLPRWKGLTTVALGALSNLVLTVLGFDLQNLSLRQKGASATGVYHVHSQLLKCSPISTLECSTQVSLHAKLMYA